jgi:hypothetical protein
MFRRIGCIAVIVPFCTLAAGFAHASDAPNLLLNADLTRGAANRPEHWRSEAWVNSPEAFADGWTRGSEGRHGEVEVANLKPNDARLIQSLVLNPGWYHVTADIRTEQVGTAQIGATISILEDSIMSADVTSNSDWTSVGFYLHVGDSGANVDVALRLGGYGSLNTGRAFFRNPSVARVPTPPAGATPVYDLTTIRMQHAPKPLGSPWSLVLTFALLAAVAVWGWRTFLRTTREVADEAAKRATQNRRADRKKRRR